MHDGRSCQQPPSGPGVKVTKSASTQIVDQDTPPRLPSPCGEVALCVVVGQVMKKQRRHQYVVFLWQRIDERVELEKLCARQLGLVVRHFARIRRLSRLMSQPCASTAMLCRAASLATPITTSPPPAAISRIRSGRPSGRIFCFHDAAPNYLRSAANRIRCSKSVERTVVRFAIKSRLIHQLRLPISLCQELQFPLPSNLLQRS